MERRPNSENEVNENGKRSHKEVIQQEKMEFTICLIKTC